MTHQHPFHPTNHHPDSPLPPDLGSTGKEGYGYVKGDLIALNVGSVILGDLQPTEKRGTVAWAPSRGELVAAVTVAAKDERAPDDYEQKIERYMSTAGMIGSHWLNGDARKRESNVGPTTSEARLSGFNYSAATPRMAKAWQVLPELRTDMYDGEQGNREGFIKRGVYETCTIERLGLRHKNYPGEPVVAVTYQASGIGYKDDSKPHSRDGNVMFVKFVLPESIAKELESDARQDPRILRDIAERYMQTFVLSEKGKAPGGDWDRYGRPPYVEWDKRNRNVVAFRTRFDQTFDEIPQRDFVPMPVAV